MRQRHLIVRKEIIVIRMNVIGDNGIMSTNLTYTAVITQDEDGVYIANCPDLPGCSSYGYTFDEAKLNIREAAELAVIELRESGSAVPPPGKVVIELIDLAV